MQYIGITGTNGKTTTASLVYHILSKLGKKASLVGTIKHIVVSKEQKSNYTTPDFLSLRKILKKAKDAESEFVVIEVSSHAIAQERIRGIKFTRCLFTNLSRDHLDYHLTLENYFDTKKSLFLANREAISLINLDDPYGEKLLPELNRALSYGNSQSAHFRVKNIKLDNKSCCFDLIYLDKTYPVKASLSGQYNVMNILGAISLVLSLGFPVDKVIKAVSSFKAPEGRLEPVEENIFVDYAHTPDALEKVLESLKGIKYKKIICLLGCGGDRDKGKRVLIGKVAAKLADYTFITADNPRSEDPALICQDIAKGFTKSNYSIVLDRKAAIKQAIEKFGAEDEKLNKNNPNQTCLLVSGKGHEDYQIIGEKRIPFKDREVIKEVIHGKNKKMLFNDLKILKKLLQAKEIRNPDNFKAFETFSIDSRTLVKDEAFIAIKGLHYDGHEFIKGSVKKGAVLIVAEEYIPSGSGVPVIVVEDSYKALGAIARYIREKKNPFVCAITGSLGKTTTKEMMYFLLKDQHKVLRNKGTENNFLGLSKTILSLRDEKIMILELGTNAKGEIQNLSEVCLPNAGVVTFIKPAHLQGLEDLKGIWEEKASMFKVNPKAIAILNRDDNYLAKTKISNKTVWFGKSKNNHLFATLTKRGKQNLTFIIQDKYELVLPLHWEAFITNALAAISGAQLLNISLKSLVRKMNQFTELLPLRMQKQELAKFSILNDAYNANPYSFSQSLKVLKNYPLNKIAVVGDMLELGKKSLYYHQLLAEEIIQSNFACCLTFGNHTLCLKEKLLELGYKRAHHFSSHKEIAEFINQKAKKTPKKRYLIFLKGSRKMGLEKVLDYLET